MTISVDLDKQAEAALSDLVSTGGYGSQSDVVREGIRLVQERDRRQVDLDAAIGLGVAEADAGLFLPAEEVLTHLEQKYRTMAVKK